MFFIQTSLHLYVLIVPDSNVTTLTWTHFLSPRHHHSYEYHFPSLSFTTLTRVQFPLSNLITLESFYPPPTTSQVKRYNLQFYWRNRKFSLEHCISAFILNCPVSNCNQRNKRVWSRLLWTNGSDSSYCQARNKKIQRKQQYFFLVWLTLDYLFSQINCT